jgi:hypothetical protein
VKRNQKSVAEGRKKRNKKKRTNINNCSNNTDLFSELTSFFGRIEDLVIEDGEIESQSQPDGMRRLHLGLADFESILVRLLRIVHDG